MQIARAYRLLAWSCLWIGGGCEATSSTPMLVSPAAFASDVTTVHISPRGATAVAVQALVQGSTNGGLTTTGAGGTATFQIVLDAAPTASVTVNVTSSNTAQGAITTPALVAGNHPLTFTTGNWSTPQTVTITGVSDPIADGDQAYTVGYSATSSDGTYNGLSATLFNVTNTNSNRAAIFITSGGLTTDKTGATATFTVNLTSQPTASVVIALSSTDTTAGVVSPSPLTFSTANWGTAQTVTITGQQNYAQSPSAGANTYHVQVGPTTSVDTTYSALPSQLLLVSNLDTQQNLLTIVAGSPGLTGTTDSTGAAARFSTVNTSSIAQGISVAPDGTVYLADQSNNTIRKVSPKGVVTTLAGSGAATEADGTGAAASFYNPAATAARSDGSVYVLDRSGMTVRVIDPSGVVTTLAGVAGAAAFADGTGAAARFNNSNSAAIDGANNLYVADYWNTAIRKITPAGVVSTLATDPGFGVTGIARDSVGNIYFADSGNVIKKVDTSLVVTTFAGQANIAGFVDGTGTAAVFNFPLHITVDASDNLYVADYGNNVIRKITPARVVSTVVGAAGQATVQAGWLPAALHWPGGIAMFGNTMFITADSALLRAARPVW